MAAGHAGAGEVGAEEARAGEVGASEVDAREVRLVQVGFAELGAAEVGAGQVGPTQPGVAQVGVVEVGAAEVATRQARSPQVLAGELGVSQGLLTEPVEHEQGVALDGVGGGWRGEDASSPVAGRVPSQQAAEEVGHEGGDIVRAPRTSGRWSPAPMASAACLATSHSRTDWWTKVNWPSSERTSRVPEPTAWVACSRSTWRSASL